MEFVRVATLDSNVHGKELLQIIFYSISFDECMNRISQNEQMDLIIRYWDGNTNKVAVRYPGSEFLGHATAVNILTHFKQGISRLDPNDYFRCLWMDQMLIGNFTQI